MKNTESIGNFVFAGCMFIGGGIGFATDNLVAGGAIGMGVGFIARAIIVSRNNNND